MKQKLFYGDTYIFHIKDVRYVKYDNLLTEGYIDVEFCVNGSTYKDTMSGYGAQEFIYELRPTALEGKRFKWRKHAWAFHNLVGHPIMQILAWCKLYDAAMWVHDVTAPKTISNKVVKS